MLMKKILITGANRGLGLEHARGFVEHGVFVFATARVPHAADELNELARANAELVKVLAYDAKQTDKPAQLKAELDSVALDLVLFNAGANGTRLRFGEIDSDATLQLFRTNAIAPL